MRHIGHFAAELHELPHTKHEQVATLAIPDVLADYLANAEHGVHTGRFDAQFCGLSQDDARRIIAERPETLHSDALIHGDYCLPNIMLDDWRLAGFIDLDHAGFSDRHVDIFWESGHCNSICIPTHIATGSSMRTGVIAWIRTSSN